MSKKIVIGIDFDGTCVTHEFPKIGEDIGAVPVLKEIVKNGNKLILFTMRSDIINPKGTDNELHLESGDYLSEAFNWFKRNEIPLYGVQTNPTQHTWTTSPKAYCNLYIDDAAIGCPLLYGGVVNGKHIKHKRPFVDWKMVRSLLIFHKIIDIEYSNVTDIVFEGVDKNDSPDYSDAYIVSAKYEGEDMDTLQITVLNSDANFVHEKLIEQIH